MGQIDIRKDITKLLTADFVKKINAFNCSAASDVIPVPYFTGIQAGNGVKFVGSTDQLTANFYINNVKPGIDDKNSLIRHWKLLHYYNKPSMNPPNPALTRSRSGTYFESLYRENRNPLRHGKRSESGIITEWGDQQEVRLLGIWGVAPGTRFWEHNPEFAGSNAAEDRRDFPKFWRDNIDRPEWKRFMFVSAWNTGLAMKCGLPIMMHSGGGPVGSFLVRLLAETKGIDFTTWRPNGRFVLLGFEAVLTQGVCKLFRELPAYGDRVVMENYVIGKARGDMTGSSTWTGTISPELYTAGFIPLVTHSAVGSKTSFWNPAQAGHGGVGVYPLRYGRIPNQPFPQP